MKAVDYGGYLKISSKDVERKAARTVVKIFELPNQFLKRERDNLFMFHNLNMSNEVFVFFCKL